MAIETSNLGSDLSQYPKITTEIEENQIVEKAMMILARQRKELLRINEAQSKQLTEQAPKVEGYDDLMGSHGLYSVAEAAKTIGTGRNRLFDLLRKAHILNGFNIPFQRWMVYFEVKTTVRSGIEYKVTYVNPKGLVWINRKFKGKV